MYPMPYSRIAKTQREIRNHLNKNHAEGNGKKELETWENQRIS
jgi:hypothetical protein